MLNLGIWIYVLFAAHFIVRMNWLKAAAVLALWIVLKILCSFILGIGDFAI